MRRLYITAIRVIGGGVGRIPAAVLRAAGQSRLGTARAAAGNDFHRGAAGYVAVNPVSIAAQQTDAAVRSFAPQFFISSFV